MESFVYFIQRIRNTDWETIKSIVEAAENIENVYPEPDEQVEVEYIQNEEMDEILELLGENPQQSKVLDNNLRPSLGLRWNHWISNGILKQVKGELLIKYARKTESDAPRLNPKIRAVISESASKRDNFIVENERMAGSALSALGSVLSSLMSDDDSVNKLEFIQKISDAGKLILEIHHNETNSRKAFILPSVSRQVRSILQESEQGTRLFGDNLTDKIKEANAIEKLSGLIKNQPVIKQSTLYRSNLNYKGPQVKELGTNKAGYMTNQGLNRGRIYFRQGQTTRNEASMRFSVGGSGGE